MLGRLRVRQGERETMRFRTQKTGPLVGSLACHLERNHPRGVLMDILSRAGLPRAELLRLAPCPDSGTPTLPQGG
jgi:hypothetical protein